jgi:type I restriction enzyme M protein
MPTQPSNEDAFLSPSGDNPEFDRILVFSAWLLLASYDDESDEYADLHEDADVANLVEAESIPRGEVLEPDNVSPLRYWRYLDPLNDYAFQQALDDELIPSLRRNFPEHHGHPLGLVPLALKDKPTVVLRREWNRAMEFWEGGDFNREEARVEWGVMSVERSAFRHPAALLGHIEDFLVEALAPQKGESFLTIFGRDGGVVARAAELGVRRFTVCDRDPRMALLAATRIRLRDDCEVTVNVDDQYTTYDLKPIYDCVVAAPPFGHKLEAHKSSVAAVPTRRVDLANLQLAVGSLKPGGRAAVLMSNRFLFGEGEDRLVRKWLMREHRIEAVVGLPVGKHFGGYVKTSVILIRRMPPQGDVWFIRPDQILKLEEPRIFSEESEGSDIDHEILLTAIKARWNLGKTEELRAEIAKLETATPMAKFPNEDSDANARLTPNNRQLLALAHHFLHEPTPGMRFPELVPVTKLARRKWELLWKDGETEDFDEWLKPVEKIVGVRITTLGELAKEIFVGIPYTSAKTQVNIGYLVGEGGVGLIRVSDLPSPKSDNRVLVDPHKSLVAGAIGEVAPRQFLRAGDLLISRNGSVGKTGVIMRPEDIDQKAVAANGIIVVRLGDRRLANFFAKLLQSAPYQASIQSETTGSVIRFLRVETISSLRVPVLPSAEMLRLMEVLQPGVGAETMLAALQSRESYTVALRYLIDRAIVREFASSSTEEPWQKTHQTLREVITELHGAEEDAARGESDVFLNWTVSFVKSAEDLDEILSFNAGVEQYAALSSWRPSNFHMENMAKIYEIVNGPAKARAEQELTSLSGNLLKRCQQLHDRLVGLSRSAIHALLGEVQLSATIAPAIITVAMLAEVQFSVTNRGLLPLRRFEANTTSFVSVTTAPLLSSGGTHVWTLVLTPSEAGRQTVSLLWKAQRLDEQLVSGSLELAVDVQAVGISPVSANLGENPYIYGRVLEGTYDTMFYGRDRDMGMLESKLHRSGPTTVILLEGNRRIGKTSLLKHFVRHRLPEGWVPVFINFQDFDGHQPQPGERTLPGIPTRNIYLGMARELVSAAHDVLPTFELPELGSLPPKSSLMFRKFLDNKLPSWFSSDQPFAQFRSLLEIVREAVRPKRLLFMLDEFDRIQEGIDSGITSDQVPENIRHLFQSYGDIAGIFTGARIIRRLRQEYWNVLFGLGETHQLQGLEEAAAVELVEMPVAGRLVYSLVASRRIVELCARQPLLIQSLCGRLFEICKDTGERTITLEMVEKVAAEKAADNEHFETLWGYIRSNRQRCIAFIVDELSEQGVTLDFNSIRDAAEQRGIGFRSALDLESDLDELLDLEALGVHGERRRRIYRIEVPLFSMWLKRTKDFEQYRRAATEET